MVLLSVNLFIPVGIVDSDRAKNSFVFFISITFECTPVRHDIRVSLFQHMHKVTEIQPKCLFSMKAGCYHMKSEANFKTIAACVTKCQ